MMDAIRQPSAGAREQAVDLALFPLDCIEQAIEVVEIGRVAVQAGHVPANQLGLFTPVAAVEEGRPSYAALTKLCVRLEA